MKTHTKNRLNIKNLDQSAWLDYLDVSTHHRESIYEFLNKKIGYRKLLHRCYNKPTKECLFYWFKKYGINNTRKILNKIIKKYTDNGIPKFV